MLAAKEKYLKDVFSDEYAFEIPSYQRPYLWEEDNARALFDDILSAAKNANFANTEELSKIEPYFLGSIVLIKNDNLPESEIVDGQQRLTTLTILLAVIRSEIKNRQDLATKAEIEQQISEYIYKKPNAITESPGRYRLKIRSRDQQFFEKSIQSYPQPEAPETYKFPQTDLNEENSDSEKHIIRNAIALRDEINKLPSNEIHRILKFLMEKVSLVMISTPNRDAAFRIFSVLNNRGISLTPPDILKADIIGSIQNEQEQDKLTALWETIEDNLGRTEFVNLFSHIRMIYRKSKLVNLYKEFSQDIIPQQDPKQFIEETLVEYSDILALVKKIDSRPLEPVAQLKRYLFWLNRLDNEDWTPPAMSFWYKWKKKSTDTDCLSQFFYSLDRLSYVMYILRYNVNTRIKRYGDLLKEIDTFDFSQNNVDSLQQLKITNEETKEIFQSLEGDIYSEKYRLLLLLRLDDALNQLDSNPTVDYSATTFTVEHVLPQKPEDNSTWAKNFPELTERNKLANSLGNLVLLTRRKNSSAGNKEFQEKVSKYLLQTDNTKNLALTNSVSQYGIWNSETIQERTKEFIKVLKNYWNLES